MPVRNGAPRPWSAVLEQGVLALAAVTLVAWPDLRPVAVVILMMWVVDVAHGLLRAARERDESEKWADSLRAFRKIEIDRQDKEVLEALEKHREVSDTFEEEFPPGPGRHGLSEAAITRATALNKRLRELETDAQFKGKLLDLMIQANANVATGAELRTVARERVRKRDYDDRFEEVLRSAKADREADGSCREDAEVN